ncbi:MAG: hypothetical protein WAK69_20700 [Rhodoplanes sp.]
MAIAKAVAGTERRSDDMAILKERFPDDPIAPLVLRAASQPAMLATDTALGRSVVADLIATIGPGGAGTRVLQSGLQLTFDSAGAIYVPGLEATADKVSFVREGAPIPVHGFSATGALLEPRKLAVITALSAEMIAGSNAEALVTDALTRATSLAIDAALFDDVASDEVRPAGLRYAIAASAASASTDPDEAMIADLSALAATVSVIGGPIMFVTAPGRAAVISLRAQRELPFPVLGSPAVAPDDVIAIATQGIASATDAIPEISSSRMATVHMDTAPLPIADGAGTLAAPTRSLWQSNAIGIKLTFGASWALRDPRALAWMTVSEW